MLAGGSGVVDVFCRRDADRKRANGEDQTMRWMPPLGNRWGALIRWVDQVAECINPILVIVIVGLLILDLTFFAANLTVRSDRPGVDKISVPLSATASGSRLTL